VIRFPYIKLSREKRKLFQISGAHFHRSGLLKKSSTCCFSHSLFCRDIYKVLFTQTVYYIKYCSSRLFISSVNMLALIGDAFLPSTNNESSLPKR